MTTLDDYQWLFRRAPIMATSIGENGRYLDVNDAMLGRLGYAREDMIGRRPADFVTRECAERIEHELMPTLKRTGRLDNKSIDFVSRDGETVRCRVNSLVERSADGRFVRTVAMYTEVFDEARIDWKYRQLYRHTPAMLHTVDADGSIITVTDHWLHKMGYSREAVLGRPVRDFYSDDDRRRLDSGALEELTGNGEFNNVPRQMVTRDGRVLDLLMSSVPEKDAAGNVHRLLVASKDVTERLQAERDLRKALAENAQLREELERERDYLREEVNVAMNFGRIIGRSRSLKKMLAQIEAVANTPASVLVLGESGVGKELVAHVIHARSPRSAGPLVKVNCASIPHELFESEFFGHVKGAFTGAHRDRIGRFQLADGGTIFLDEVGEIPLDLQSKLLRVLQESEYERVGDETTDSVDVRVIAATNRDLEQAVEEGRFREDLYYRISVFPIHVPPLRERGDDVVQIASHFVERICQEFGKPSLTLSRQQASFLKRYDWPGNVRELKNVIERAVILSKGRVLRLDLAMTDIFDSVDEAPPKAGGEGSVTQLVTDTDLKRMEKENMLNALRLADWRVSGPDGAAKLVGLKPTTFADRMKKHGIARPRRGHA